MSSSASCICNRNWKPSEVISGLGFKTNSDFCTLPDNLLTHGGKSAFMFGSHLAVPCVNLSCPCVSSYLCLQTSSFFWFYWCQSILPSRNCSIFTCLLSSSQLTSRSLQKREKRRHHGLLTSLHALTLTWVPTPQSSLLFSWDVHFLPHFHD